MATSRCPQTPVSCHDCKGSSKINTHCLSCNGYVCSECEFTHSQQSGVHRFVSKELFHKMRSFPNEKCTIHETNDFTVYCDECKIPCCGHCLSERHLQHKLTNLNEKLGITVQQLEKYVFSLQNHLLPTYQNMKEKLDVHQTEQECEIEQTKTVITERCRELREEIDRLEKQLLDNVDSSASKLRNELTKMEQYADSKVNTIKQLIKQCENNFESPSSKTIDFHVQKCVPLAELQPSPVVCPTNLLFVSMETDAMKKLVPLIGELKQGPPSVLIPFGNDLDIISSFQINYVPFTIAPISSTKSWISCPSHQAALYNTKGKKQNESFFSENFFAVSSSGEFIISHKQELRSVFCGKTKRIVGTEPFLAKGVCYNENQDIVVCLADADKRKSLKSKTSLTEATALVRVYRASDKRKLLDIHKHHENGGSLFSNPERVAQNNNGNYVVTDTGAQSVIAVSRHGQFRWKYQGIANDEKEKHFDPQGISCDKYSKVIVSDTSNHKIHVIDSDGDVITIVDTRAYNIFSPFAIGIDLESNLWCVGTKDMRNFVCQIRYVKE